MQSVRTVDVSRGIHGDMGVVVRDAAIGTGLGIASAAAITGVSCVLPGNSGDGPPCVIGFIVLGPALGLVGLVVGGWIGADHRVERWERVYDREQTTSLLIGPTPRGGIAIGLSVAFGGPSPAP
jgi:hypothetical protein